MDLFLQNRVPRAGCPHTEGLRSVFTWPHDLPAVTAPAGIFPGDRSRGCGNGEG
jgi:hypothetical protein